MDGLSLNSECHGMPVTAVKWAVYLTGREWEEEEISGAKTDYYV